MGNIVPILFHIPFFNRASRNHLVILLIISLSHDDSLIVDLHAEEEHCGDFIDEIASPSLEEIIIQGFYRERRRE